MITLTIILTLIIALVIIVVSILLTGGIALVTVFGDVLFAVAVIFGIVKLIQFIKR